MSAFLVGSMGIAHAEATPLTADQQVVYNAVLQELAKNGVHYVSVKGTSQDADTNYNNDGAKQTGGIAIGEKAKSTDPSDIAIGSEASSAGGWGMAIGADAKNTAQVGIAIGYATKVTSAHGLALGVQASTSGEDAISIGTNVSSSAKRGIAVGTNSNVADTAARGIAIGDGAYVCLLYTSPSPRDRTRSRMPSSA